MKISDLQLKKYREVQTVVRHLQRKYNSSHIECVVAQNYFIGSSRMWRIVNMELGVYEVNFPDASLAFRQIMGRKRNVFMVD